MSRPLTALFAAALLALAGEAASACEPCGATLDLRRSLERADVVAVVRRPALPEQPADTANGPACDELRVERVLKGEAGGEKLLVRSWHGMYPYGVILGEGTYVVILRRAAASDYDSVRDREECAGARAKGAELFAAVEHGCAVKSLRVESGAVEAEGVKMTIEEFREKYDLKAGAGPRGPAAAAGLPSRGAGVHAAAFSGPWGWPRLF